MKNGLKVIICANRQLFYEVVVYSKIFYSNLFQTNFAISLQGSYGPGIRKFRQKNQKNIREHLKLSVIFRCTSFQSESQLSS